MFRSYAAVCMGYMIFPQRLRSYAAVLEFRTNVDFHSSGGAISL
jgi:hypothetical protein